MKKKWLVFYTKSRAEKKTYSLLIRAGFQTYLPLHKVLRQWSDRKKKVEVPLFNSYIFVQENESRISKILQIPGITRNIRYNGQPAYLAQSEIETIQRFLETGLTIETSGMVDIDLGDEVEIMDGPLRGLTGVLTNTSNQRQFALRIDALELTIKIEAPRAILKKIS